MSWGQFLKLHWEVLAATDFFTVEVATWHGLVTYYVLFVMELARRRVHVAGITPHPTAAFMQQCARQLTDPFDGFLVGKQYLIRDRDTKFDTVAAILHSIWTGQSIAFILPLPTFFLREPIRYGPGRYVPDSTAGMTNVKDLPAPQRVAYHRDHTQTACPRCGHLASRHTSGQRT
jgi:hypothetical protein